MPIPVSRRHFLLGSATVAATAASLTWPVAPARAATATTGANWMSMLPSGQPLSALTIPGTHDSGATRWGPLVQCQTASLSDQLAWGVRFLDIRCYNTGSSFLIYHGGFYQQLTFQQVVSQCATFLAANPGETILLCLKQEYSSRDTATMNRVYASETAAWRSLIVDDDTIPTLGEVRGKIVIVSRDLGIPGLDFSSWHIEDHYQIADEAQWHQEKWPAVSGNIESARAQRGDGQMWITFTSSTGAFLNPRQAADLMTPALQQFLDARPAQLGERDGIVLLDFAEAWRVQQIGARNFGRAWWMG